MVGFFIGENMQFTDKGSSQRAVTKDGYLVVPATISKVGVFDYHASELGLQETAVKKVARTENSLFSDRTLASFEGVPLTIGHPEQRGKCEKLERFIRRRGAKCKTGG